MEIIKSLLGKLAGSKKVAILVIGALSGLAAKLGLSEEHALFVAQWIWGLTLGYLGAQGAADFGKGKVEVGKGI